MRNTFLQTLLQLAESDPRIMLVVGDLGFSVVEPFAQRFPDRFLNAGIAEQNMAGVAAGLAMAGFHPFIYSIANFPTLRCLEQIRNDIAYHRQPVTVVAVGGGLGYGSLGYSHHAVQDLACLRSMPGMLMATPGDPQETVAATRFLVQANRPSYLRLGKGGEPKVHAATPTYSKLGPQMVRTGSRNAVLACGNTLWLADQAAAAQGASLLSCPLWDDSDDLRDAILATVSSYDRVVVVEEHLAAGGFGSFVRECLENHPELQARVRCRSLNPEVCGHVAAADKLRALGGLTIESISRGLC
jgi:transketolase